ncbi:Ig-like domain-containing protein [Pseudomonas sp. WHRI 8519]|uniref:Ig-like domain-containing protein n=1 Tax=Pseudomonas sp. WHRI 8519 TaxID=3162567 RepID=UPI0032ED027B
MAFWKRNKKNQNPSVSMSRPSLIQALEPRMMFDASVAVVADQGAQAAEAATATATSKDTATASDTASTQDSASHESAQQAAPATAPATLAAERHEVVFVDSAVSDYQKLIAGLPAGVEVVLLENGKDGFKQIADYLDGRTDVTSIDIISHGDSGYVYLAGNAIWANQLASHQADLARIGASLAEGGDIRFFACNTGQGSDGQLFVDEVARLSGADVGASADSTGNRAGEDWELETVSGVVATGVGVQRGDLTAFNTSLATITVTDTNASSVQANGLVSLAEAIQAANTDASVDGSAAGSGSDIIVFHQSLSGQTIRWSTASALLVTSNITINGDVDGDGRGDIILSGDVNNNGVRDATEASGLQSNSGGVLTVRNLDFREFSGNLVGGAIRANSGSITIEDSNFQNNAGAVINSATTVGSAVVVRNTTIHDNSGSIVGATAMSSLVRLGGANNHVLENVAIYNNTGTYAATGTVAGGAVIVLNNAGGSVNIVNSTIANNVFLNTSTGSITSAGLGWVNGQGGTITVQNSILTGNTVNGAAADAVTGSGYTSITNLIGTTVNFVNAAGGDYRLASTASNAIDQGTSSGAPATDLRGFERPRGGAVDIGAYEVLYSAPPVVDLDTNTGGNDSTVNFTGTAVAIVPNISLTQTDGDTQVSGASLSLSGVADGANETLSLSAAQIATAAGFGITVSGSGSAVLTLSGVATLAQYRAVLASVAYGNAAAAYTTGTRTVTVSVNDDMGSTTRTASVAVLPQNSAPVIGNLNGDSAVFTQGNGAILLDAGSNATVSDSDSADFGGGNLTASISANGVAGEDTLGIRSVGNGAGQISLSGNTVSYGGVAIGTVAGGTGGASLVVTFNANATAAAVQALVRSITYDNGNAGNGIGQANRAVSLTVSDGDGATSGTATVQVTVRETVPPTASISLSDTALKVGDTATVTFTFSEAVTGFSNADLTVVGGTLSAVSSSDGGLTWTATFTPSTNITVASAAITLNNTGVADLAGNAGSGTTVSPSYSIDTQRPTATIVVADNALRAGETSLVTITFSEAVSGFTNADLSVANGTLSTLSSSDGGITWTATFTPTSNVTDATNLITLNNTGVTDSAGNAGTGTTNSNNYSVDTQRPVATIVVADTALSIGETSLVTITFSEAVTGFSNADLTVANGTLSAVSSSDGGITWTATFTPTSNVTDATNLISLDNTGVTDAAGNTGSGTTDSNNYAIDTVRPVAAIVVADSNLAIGETSTVTITFNEPVTGLSLADFTVQNGTLSGLSTSDNITWTATFTPAANVTDTSNLITLDNAGVVDTAGNAGTGSTGSNNYAIDTQRPTAAIVMADTALNVGESTTVTITFSEAVSGFTLADLSAPNGTLSGLSSSDGGITWTATFTPSINVQDATNVITLANTGVTDLAGNAGSGTTDSSNYTVSTLQPTATIVVSDAALRIGETSLVTITFSEAVTGFTPADLTVANGALSGLSSSDGGITWTATFTPASNVTDTSNLITLDNSGVVGQSSGNAGFGTTDSNNYAIDTQRPTATVVVAESQLAIGETSLVTITFSEAVVGLSNADLAVSNGTLSAVASSDGGITWTALFTPTSNVTDASNLITLDNTGVADLAGNAGSGSTDSNNYAIDSLRPTATIVVADSNLTLGETSQVTITFSEAVTGFTNADLTVANGTLSAVASADGGITWTATFTPAVGVRDATNVITLANTGIADLAGNLGSGTTSSSNYSVDTIVPTATIVVADTALSIGETSLVTITFSEAVSGFSNADLTVANGTLSAVSSSDGGITWTATFTPTSNVTDTSNLISLDNTGVVGQSGNAGVGTTDSNNYAIDTQRPTATIVVADSQLAIGETSLVTITFSEPVVGFSLAELSVANGTLSGLASSDGGLTWTATLTPSAGISDTSNLITLDNTGVADLAGNAGSGSTDSNNYAIDSLRPTATIVVADSNLTLGETSQVTITFSEAVTGFTNADLTVANGTLSAVSSADGGITWTATFTPAVGVRDATNVITLANTGIADLAGNLGSGTTSSSNYSVDTIVPTATIVVADTALSIGETSLVTITFSEAVSGFSNADLTVANGTLSAVSSSDGGITWTATFTPTSNVTDTSNLISLDNTGVVGQSGNAGVGTTDSNNYAIDTQRPIATIVVAESQLAIGETSLVTITFSEPVVGFSLADLSVANGTLSGLASSDGGLTWTATLTPSAGISDTSNLITLDNTGVADLAGNAGSGSTDSNNYAIDSLRPTATIVVADSNLTLGETSQVTITFSEAVTGFTNADLTVANGTLSAVSSADGGITWTATFTPAVGVRDATNVITLANTGIADLAGNLGTGTTSSSNYSVDTIVPTATIVVADTALSIGETSLVTITFSEAVSDFSNADLTVANGTLSTVSSSDGGITWTATFTPASNVTDTSNLISLDNTGVAGQSGNAGVGTTDSNNYAIDTQRPTATIVVADSQLAIGETSLVTITFSEPVVGFSLADLSVANGTLSGLASSDGGLTWTATLTPSSGISDTSNLITLDNTGVADLAGNAGSGSTDSNNYAIDSLRPTATIVVADSNLTLGETSQVTITFSEAVTGFTNADLTVANGTLSAVSSTDGGITWTATFTPAVGVRDATNVITLANTGIADLAGNLGTGTTSSGNYAVDTIVPTATIVVADNALRAGESSLVTITFSEAVSGFTLADMSAANGVLSNLSSQDGGITWTATLTPTSNVEDTSNLVSLDNSGVVATASGNAGVGSSISNNYAIDTRVPSVTSVGGPAGVSYNAGDALVFVVNASEAVQVAGSPRLALDVGGRTVFAELIAGAGTPTLVFQYIVQAGDNDSDGIRVTGLSANGATLSDAQGNAMNLALNGIADTSTVLVDTLAPAAVGIVTLDPSLSNAQSVRFTVTFSERVNGVDLADFSLVASGTASATLSGLRQISDGVYEITASGVSGSGTLGLNLKAAGTAISDVAGNVLTGGLTGAVYTVDHDAPTVTSVSVPVGVHYNTGDTLTFVVDTSEAVIVDGTPQLALDVGGRTVYADFVAGSGTPTLVFQYRIQAGDNDADGIQVVGLAANGATLHDAAGNALQPGLGAVGDSTGIIVDTRLPSVESIVPMPANGSGSQGFIVTFSEAVRGVDLSDFQLVSSGSASGTLQSLVQIDSRTWQVNAVGVAGSGSLALALNNSGTGISDMAGNGLEGGFVGQGSALQSTGADAQFLAYPTTPPSVAGQPLPLPGTAAPAFSAFQSPLLPVPLFEVPSVGGGLPPLGSIFIREGALAPSYLAQVFAGQQGGSAIGNGSGSGFLGFGGGDASVFGASSLANIFDKTLPDDGGQYELSGGNPWRQGGEGQAGAPTLGQQLQAFKEGEQRHVRELALALGQIKAPMPEA